MSIAPRLSRVDYPTSDGKPMAETDLHRDLMLDAIKILQHRYGAQEDVYVSGNLLIYYEPGNKRKHISPDVFVVFGVPKRKRQYFLTWEEGKFPRVIIELTSKSTKREDIRTKKELYREVFKAKEYFLFDPCGDYLNPRLQGFRRVRGEWKPIPLLDGKMFSETLGLEMRIDGNSLRFFDPETQQYLASPEERAEIAEDRAVMAEDRAEIAEDRAVMAEDRVELAEDRAGMAVDRAEIAEDRAVMAEDRAGMAVDRAEQAESAQRKLAEENERLRRELEALRRGRQTGNGE